MTFAKRTPEDRKAEMEALHARLTEQVEALRSSDQWTAYLDYCRSFHRYSLNNLLLIYCQRPESTRVAGYKAWQSRGRQVRKGEKGLRIFGTGTVKTGEDDKGEDMRRRIFFPVSVFDIGQTDLMEGREDPADIARHLTGADAHDILGAVTAVLTARGVLVKREPISGQANGYTGHQTGQDGPLLVVIDSDLSPAQAAKTALHEAGHIFAGHLDEDYAEYVAHRGRFEVEAESVAYVMAGLLGLDTSAYSTGYVAGWAGEAPSDVLRATAARVLATVHALADALGLDAPEA